MGDTNTGTVPTFNSAQIPESSADYHNDFAYEDFMGVHYYNTALPPDRYGINPIPAWLNNQIEYDGNNKGNVFKYDKDTNDNVCRLDVDEADYLVPSTTLDQTFGDGRMYKKFTHRFRRLLFSWNPKATTPSHYETYTPIMTIMNGKFADLDLYFDIKEKPKGIRFQFNHSDANKFFEIKLDGGDKIDLDNKDDMHLENDLDITLDAKGKSTTDKIKHKLEINCIGEFAQEYTLFAYAYKEDEPDGTIDKKGEVCGMLRILPNGEMYQRKVKILFIRVITNFNSAPTPNRGSWNANALKILEDVLGLGLVITEVIKTQKNGSDLIIDTTKPKSKKNKKINFRDEFCTLQGLKYVIDDADASNLNKAQRMRDYLLAELDCIDNGKYKNYYKVFLMDENVNTGTIGYSWNLSGIPYVVCFNNTKNYDSVITHEILHALELAHPFDAYSRNTPFSHHFCTTNNIMDYTQTFHVMPLSATKTNPVTGNPLPADAIGLFHWQWQVINPKIR